MSYYLDTSDHPWMEPFHAIPFHRIPWDGGAQYQRSYPDDDGDGVHSGSWTFTKTISPCVGKWNNGVKAKLHITSYTRTLLRTRKANRYHLTVTLHNVSMLVCAARCTSVRDAKAHADRIDLSAALRELLHKVYRRNNARCVFDASGTPLLSTFDDLYGWRDNLPAGTYYDIDPVEHWSGKRRAHQTKLWGSGYCAGTVDAAHVEFANSLQPWT